jgi:iron complex outermembrane receptor protein
LVLTTMLAGVMATPALGQSAEPEDGVGDEIVVTAQRRAQNLQDVPAAVTALSDVALEQQQIRDVQDLQYQIPNISIAAGTGTANSARIFLRGVGEDESRGAVDPAVGIYVDGIYIGRQVGALLDLVDLERIEVLRGPQGTLYGRNTNGGAIKLISKTPGGENEGRVGVLYGNYDRLDVRGMANLAVGDNAGLRVTGLYRKQDGFWDLNPNGELEGEGRTVGDLDTVALRAAFSVDFAEGWNALLIGDYTEDNSDPVPDSAAPPNDRDNDLFTIEPLPGTECDANSQVLGCFLGYGSEVKTGGVSLNLTGQIGMFDVMSLTGYREMEDDLATRIGSPFFQQTDQDQFSQELTLTSNLDGPFNFVAGAYFFEEDVQLDSTFVFDSTLVFDTSSIAGFVHGTFDIGDRATVTAGTRYTDEKREFAGRNTGLTQLTGSPLFAREDKVSFDNWTYNVALDYDVTDDVMAYASFSTGFKAAGWSPDCFSPNIPGIDNACYRPVDEEEIESFEIGVRSVLMDSLRLNVTYFNNVYEGLQIGATVPDLGFTRFNVDETHIQGIEVEANWALTDYMSLFGNLGLLDAEYDSVTEQQAAGLTNSGASCPGGIATVECALGLSLKNAPEYKGQVGMRYEMEPTFGGRFLFTGDVSFEDESWSLVANNPPHALTDPGLLLNARLAYTPPSDRYTISVFGQNLGDQEYWRAASAQFFTAYGAPPLTYGVDLDVRF